MTEILEKRVYKRLPLDEKGELLKVVKGILSPRNLVVVKFPKSGSTLSICDVPKILVGDSEGGTNYFNPTNRSLLFDDEVIDDFVKTQSYGYIPRTIFDLVDELKHANKIADYWKLYNSMENARDPKVKEEIRKRVIEAINNMKFPILAIDTITSLTDISNTAALEEYKFKFPNAAKKDSIKKVDDYGGVQHIRRKFAEIKSFIENNAAPFIQYHGHVGQKKKILKKGDEDINALDIALDGIMSVTFTSKADAVCTFYREKDGCYLDFSKKEETDLGSRPPHISNKKIKIAEIVSDADLEKGIRPKTYWNLIYPEICFD